MPLDWESMVRVRLRASTPHDWFPHPLVAHVTTVLAVLTEHDEAVQVGDPPISSEISVALVVIAPKLAPSSVIVLAPNMPGGSPSTAVMEGAE